MKTVEINASEKYNVLIGSGLMGDVGELVRGVCPASEKAAVITDDTVDALFAGQVCRALSGAGFKTVKYILPHGEGSKNAENFIAVLNFLALSQLTRSDVLIALGGGVVGDLAGFAASVYLRGIDYIQVPTTLLADVDSSVGGKTAIDLDCGKNLAGAFCQPKLVICSYDTLGTLPRETFADGCAEVIKYGILGDEELFSHLERYGMDFDTEYVLERCIAMKSSFVCRDEFDTGVRRQLNLGHTLGHAVEAESGYTLSHGKSVAIGLAAVARASANAGYCSAECAGRICALIEKFTLPVRTDKPIDELYGHMLSDKKRLGGTVNVIIPERIGACRVQPMDLEQLRKFMKAGL